jgi:hypothetical protein
MSRKFPQRPFLNHPQSVLYWDDSAAGKTIVIYIYIACTETWKFFNMNKLKELLTTAVN